MTRANLRNRLARLEALLPPEAPPREQIERMAYRILVEDVGWPQADLDAYLAHTRWPHSHTLQLAPLVAMAMLGNPPPWWKLSDGNWMERHAVADLPTTLDHWLAMADLAVKTLRNEHREDD